MSKQETDKTKAEQASQIDLADLAVDEARQDEVKGGRADAIEIKQSFVRDEIGQER
jgi:hypothetical protein